MKYIIVTIILAILIFIAIISLMKKMAKKANISYDIIKKEDSINKPTILINRNPSFTVELLDYKNAKKNLYKVSTNDILSFKKSKDKRIFVYHKSKYIGTIAIKDYKNFSLISSNPEYFEGNIIVFPNYNNTYKKVIIKIQVKERFSREVYKINNESLNKLVRLETLLKKGEVIETNYGPSTILEIHENFLIVDVPSLGKREIYSIEDINI